MAGNISQPTTGYDYDTFADDLRALLETLDLREVTLVGHSMGTGEITRHLGRYGSARVAKGVLVWPIPPFLLQTRDNPEGLPASVFDGFMHSARDDAPAWMKAFLDNFCNIDKFRGTPGQRSGLPGQLEPGVLGLRNRRRRVHSHLGDRLPGRPAQDRCADAGDPGGDDDRVLPYPKTGERLQGMIKDLQLVVIDKGPHAIAWTHAEQVNAALLKFMA